MNDLLKKQWRDLCNDYLKAFCERHDYEYDPVNAWVGDDPGTIADVCDMFLNMEDIRYDVDNNIDPDLFAKWYWENLDRHELGLKYMNYPSFVKGAPDLYTPEQMKRLNELRSHMKDSKQQFLNELRLLGGNVDTIIAY